MRPIHLSLYSRDGGVSWDLRCLHDAQSSKIAGTFIRWQRRGFVRLPDGATVDEALAAAVEDIQRLSRSRGES